MLRILDGRSTDALTTRTPRHCAMKKIKYKTFSKEFLILSNVATSKINDTDMKKKKKIITTVHIPIFSGRPVSPLSATMSPD